MSEDLKELTKVLLITIAVCFLFVVIASPLILYLSYYENYLKAKAYNDAGITVFIEEIKK